MPGLNSSLLSFRHNALLMANSSFPFSSLTLPPVNQCSMILLQSTPPQVSLSRITREIGRVIPLSSPLSFPLTLLLAPLSLPPPPSSPLLLPPSTRSKESGEPTTSMFGSLLMVCLLVLFMLLWMRRPKLSLFLLPLRFVCFWWWWWWWWVFFLKLIFFFCFCFVFIFVFLFFSIPPPPSPQTQAVFHKYGVHSTAIQPEFTQIMKSKECEQNCVEECAEDWCCKKEKDQEAQQGIYGANFV